MGPSAVGVDVDPSGIRSALVFPAGSLLFLLWSKTPILGFTVIEVVNIYKNIEKPANMFYIPKQYFGTGGTPSNQGKDPYVILKQQKFQ